MTFLFVSFISIINAYSIPDGFIQYLPNSAWAPSPDFVAKEYIINPLPYSKLNPSLPLNFSWATAGANNGSLITSVRNQMLPNPCGSCWAHAAVGALSDRIKISMYNKTGRIPYDINLAPQYLLDLCFYSKKYECGSCNGGSSNIAYSVIHETSISDESCSPYLGQEVSLWSEQTPTHYICRQVDWFTGKISLIPITILYNPIDFGQCRLCQNIEDTRSA